MDMLGAIVEHVGVMHGVVFVVVRSAGLCGILSVDWAWYDSVILGVCGIGLGIAEIGRVGVRLGDGGEEVQAVCGV